MNESKVRGLKWNLKKVRGSVMHFSQINNILYTFIVLHANRNKRQGLYLSVI